MKTIVKYLLPSFKVSLTEQVLEFQLWIVLHCNPEDHKSIRDVTWSVGSFNNSLKVWRICPMQNRDNLNKQ